MDPFRLLLLAVGVILLIVVYYLTKRAAKPSVRSSKYEIPKSGDIAPPERPYQASFETRKPRQKRKRFVSFMSGSQSSSSLGHGIYGQATTLEPFEVVVYLMPHAGLQFRREQVITCLENVGCVPRADGADVVYDYLILEDELGKKVKRLFSVSDIHQPGIFSHTAQASEKTNSLVFKMELPGPIESVMAFERLLEVARRVATRLNGVVCDDLQNRLTKQATLHIKDKIVDYNRKLQFVQSSSIQ